MADKDARKSKSKSKSKGKLFEAIYAGDGRRVRKLLKRGVSPNATDAHGSTALYIAAVQGEAWPVGELLAAGARPNVESGGDAEGTPLCGAASWGHTSVLRRIILNSESGCFSPSMMKSALKILCRQCSLLACANIISSMSVGFRARLM